jgi:hypothetical protein
MEATETTMSDTPRSIIDPSAELVKPDRMIISPEEALNRSKPIRDGGNSKHAISRKEAVSISVQIGQEVYDQLRAEHAEVMGQLQKDLSSHLNSIRDITAMNILDIQRRSFSYRLRRDFAVDRKLFALWLLDKWEWAVAWLELHGLKSVPEEPETERGGMYEDFFGEEAENVGAPSELPEAPEIARTFVVTGD